jgi:SAM-dependent methyltransferase
LRTVLCTSCGLVWTNPRPSDAEVDRYYASEYRVDYAGQHVPSRRKILRGLIGAEERRQLFAPQVGAGDRLLDIGCGAGEFVFLLRARDIDATGIEPGEEFSDFSRRVMQVPIQTATVESATVAPASQRLITMFHMLEHAADPRRTLSTIRGWLGSEGRLVVEVPSVDATVQAPAHRFHYAHLYGFTAATLGAIGEAAGLSVVKTMHSDDGGQRDVRVRDRRARAASCGGCQSSRQRRAAAARVPNAPHARPLRQAHPVSQGPAPVRTTASRGSATETAANHGIRAGVGTPPGSRARWDQRGRFGAESVTNL